MSEISREIHITPARKKIFEEKPLLYRDLGFVVLKDVPIEMAENEGGVHILVKRSLSEAQEARLREIWEATMPPAPNAEGIRREEFHGGH